MLSLKNILKFNLTFYLFIANLICFDHVISIGSKKLKFLNKIGCYQDFHCKVYTNTFAVEIKGGIGAANELAFRSGFLNLGPIWGLTDFYEFVHPKVKRFSRRVNPKIKRTLERDEKVVWFEQQRIKFNEHRLINVENKRYASRKDKMKANKSQNEISDKDVFNFNDPLYGQQWYLRGGGPFGYDMNVQAAWKKGYTGKGIVVSILDDGVQGDHPDLIHSYDPLASIDLLHGIGDHPLPHRIPFKHGTRCAGEVSAQANNRICGVGVAFRARIGGVRILDALLTDAREARAISFNNDYIQIFSASWGPADNGKALGGPGHLAKRALYNGVTKGRNGLGVLYIWAAGNGGKRGDDCNTDGYANSIYTITVSSSNKFGLKPWYLEECSSIITTTFSSGINGTRLGGVVTTDLIIAPNVWINTLPREEMCTTTAGGTSASAPMAAGICALVLEANPRLSWRDIKYLIVKTSRYEPLTKEKGWKRNAAGKMYSHKFGFGLMDAGAMVELAKNWKSVPAMKTCKSKHYVESREIPNEPNGKIELNIRTDMCRKYIKNLEQIEAVLSIQFHPRGNLEIHLTSDSGTSSQLLQPRPNDVHEKYFLNWSFTSVHFWGERIGKRWNLTLINNGKHEAKKSGKLHSYQLIFHGI